jgi:membrane-associated protease RseP (regulator of RpoE activity)
VLPRPAAVVLLIAASGLAGCTSAPQTSPTETSPVTATAERSGGVSAKPAAPPRPRPGGEPIALPGYEVREAVFTDFGLSVRTNPEVKFGAAITWMQISAVLPGSAAAQLGLLPGDSILALDGRPITEFDRDAMLAILFLRKQGDRVDLLILGEHGGMPRFIALNALRPRPTERGPAADPRK